MKDAKGHGSNTGTKGMRLVKTHVLGPHSAKVYKNPEWEENVVKFFHNGVYQSKADSHTDDMADAHSTAQSQLQRYADLDAKNALSSGTPKSAPVPVHDGMSMSPGGRHGYSPDAVNSAIASSNRAGRRIGGREAKMIHALLKGR